MIGMTRKKDIKFNIIHIGVIFFLVIFLVSYFITAIRLMKHPKIIRENIKRDMSYDEVNKIVNVNPKYDYYYKMILVKHYTSNGFIISYTTDTFDFEYHYTIKL